MLPIDCAVALKIILLNRADELIKDFVTLRFVSQFLWDIELAVAGCCALDYNRFGELYDKERFDVMYKKIFLTSRKYQPFISRECLMKEGSVKTWRLDSVKNGNH